MSPRERTDMRSIREILRLSFQVKLSANEISRTTGISRGAVQKCLKAAKQAELVWPLPDDLDDKTLEELLFSAKKAIEPRALEPDYSYIYQELKKPGVNRQLLYSEYIGDSAEGKYSYSQFNRRFKAWLNLQKLSMPQDHKAGEKLFVDYAGQTIPVVIDRTTGEVNMTQIFVAVLGASNYTYVEASWTQDLPSWISAHVRAFDFFKGVPKCLIPDNLKSGVTKAEPFDPFLNRTYRRMADHYQCSIRPARVRKPKDKAKVEKGVQFSETWILARLRHYTFFSLAELNETIRELLQELNEQPFQKMDGSRTSHFKAIDYPALQPLPNTPFEFEEWLTGVKIESNYHVRVTQHNYSVPHQLRGQRVDIRFTDSIVEIFHNNLRIASHIRNKIAGGYTTLDDHRPAHHALYAGMSAEKFLQQAESVGPFTCNVVKAILDATPYPQLAFDKCFGILSYLRKKYSDSELETAAEYAIRIGAPTYRVMKAALEAEELPEQLTISMIDSHENIRGAEELNQ